MSDNDVQDNADSKPDESISVNRHESRTEMERAIAEKQLRRLRSRQLSAHTAWFGLGMFGVIGWSISVQIVAGIAIGLWVD